MARRLLLVLLAIELLDELIFGAREAAWPLLQKDLELTYGQVGILLGVPFYTSAVLEPFFGILGDSRWRRAVVVGGGITVAGALALAAGSPSFAALLVAFAILSPATGAFVSLSQATLMDLEPAARERNMARWGIAGGLGSVAGPLALGLFVWIGLGWRGLFAVFAGLALVLVFVTAGFHGGVGDVDQSPSVRALFRALRRPLVVRWLLLLEFADLLLDVLLGFLALYLVNEAGASRGAGGLAVAVWTGAALVGGLILVRALGRITGLWYLRFSALAALVLYPAFLLIPGAPAKIVVLGALGLATAGWYTIPKARLYEALAGQSGAALSLGSVAGLFRGATPLVVGFAADRFGLGSALWLLVIAPFALLALVPRGR